MSSSSSIRKRRAQESALENKEAVSKKTRPSSSDNDDEKAVKVVQEEEKEEEKVGPPSGLPHQQTRAKATRDAASALVAELAKEQGDEEQEEEEKAKGGVIITRQASSASHVAWIKEKLRNFPNDKELAKLLHNGVNVLFSAYRRAAYLFYVYRLFYDAGTYGEPLEKDLIFVAVDEHDPTVFDTNNSEVYTRCCHSKSRFLLIQLAKTLVRPETTTSCCNDTDHRARYAYHAEQIAIPSPCEKRSLAVSQGASIHVPPFSLTEIRDALRALRSSLIAANKIAEDEEEEDKKRTRDSNDVIIGDPIQEALSRATASTSEPDDNNNDNDVAIAATTTTTDTTCRTRCVRCCQCGKKTLQVVSSPLSVEERNARVAAAVAVLAAHLLSSHGPLANSCTLLSYTRNVSKFELQWEHERTRGLRHRHRALHLYWRGRVLEPKHGNLSFLTIRMGEAEAEEAEKEEAKKHSTKSTCTIRLPLATTKLLPTEEEEEEEEGGGEDTTKDAYSAYLWVHPAGMERLDRILRYAILLLLCPNWKNRIDTLLSTLLGRFCLHHSVELFDYTGRTAAQIEHQRKLVAEYEAVRDNLDDDEIRTRIRLFIQKTDAAHEESAVAEVAAAPAQNVASGCEEDVLALVRYAREYKMAPVAFADACRRLYYVLEHGFAMSKSEPVLRMPRTPFFRKRLSLLPLDVTNWSHLLVYAHNNKVHDDDKDGDQEDDVDTDSRNGKHGSSSSGDVSGNSSCCGRGGCDMLPAAPIMPSLETWSQFYEGAFRQTGLLDPVADMVAAYLHIKRPPASADQLAKMLTIRFTSDVSPSSTTTQP